MIAGLRRAVLALELTHSCASEPAHAAPQQPARRPRPRGGRQPALKRSGSLSSALEPASGLGLLSSASSEAEASDRIDL